MRRIGLSGFAAFSLTLTAVAPVGAVWLCAYFPTWGWKAVLAALILCVVLLTLCACLILLSEKLLQREDIGIVASHSLDNQNVGFFIAYGMPLIAGPPQQMVAPLVAFTLFLLLVVWTTQLVYVNPLAAVLGFHFHKIESSSGRTYLLLSRKFFLPQKNSIPTVRLSQRLFIDMSPQDSSQNEENQNATNTPVSFLCNETRT